MPKQPFRLSRVDFFSILNDVRHTGVEKNQSS